MKQTLTHTSASGNMYLYDHKSNMSMLIHPELKKAIENDINCDAYYKDKYKYLIDNGFFSDSSSINFATIDENTIKNCIVQVPHIVFETTDFCNLNCLYCSFGDFYEGFDTRHHRKINFDHAVRLLKYIFNQKHNSRKNQLLISFHGGEPLFNGDFIEKIVDVINQLNIEKGLDIIYSMTTNATLLHKYIAFLVENKFNLLISLDGNEVNHSYRSFRGSGENSFKKVIENIDMVQKIYREYFEEHVNFNAVLHNRNSVKEIYEFIYTRYHKIPRIAELNPCDISPTKVQLFNQLFHNKRESEAEYMGEERSYLPHEELMIYKELVNFVKYYSINSCISNIADLLANEKKYMPSNTCIPFWKKLMLTTNSKLTLCEKVSCHKLTIGEVGETVKINIPEIVKQYNYYYKHIKEKCQNCYVNKFCEICLFVMKDHNLEKIGTDEFVCEGFHSQKAFQNKLYRIFSFLEKYPKDNVSIIEDVIIL